MYKIISLRKGDFFMNYYNEIKEQILNNEITKKVKDYSKNKSDLTTYYNVGKILSEAGKHYGEGIIKEYSKRLTLEFGKGYGLSNLKNMRKFYNIFSKSQAVPDQLTWSHYIELISINDINKINYYIDISIDMNLSYRQLREKIKNNEYERLPESTKQKLINNKNDLKLIDMVKEPILITNKNNYENISEKILQKMILEDIPSFLEELGEGFTFIKNEYKIKLGDRYNYIDLLLFNYLYNCFVVIELKITELKKEHIGQVQMYMNYIDKNIKRINQNKTIGIILVKKNNKFVMGYCSDKRIQSKEYVIL